MTALRSGYGMDRQRIALLLLCTCAAGATAFALLRSTSSPSGRLTGPSAQEYISPTLARPLPYGKRVSMSDAVSAWGGALPLPDTPQVHASDVGTVSLDQVPGGTNPETGVGVSFPSQGLIVMYSRPALPDPLAYFQHIDKLRRGSSLIWLDSRTPALYTPGAPDAADESEWGKLSTAADGAWIYVFGDMDEASLRAVAQSIVNRASTSS